MIDEYVRAIEEAITALSRLTRGFNIYKDERETDFIFLDLSTAPHHKHVGETDVIAANAPDLQSVLKEIEGLIKT